MRIAAFTKYDAEAASTRQRLLQYIPALNEAGISVNYFPLLDNDYVRHIATGEGYSKINVARSYAARVSTLLRGRKWDVLWVYGELFPYLPSFFEKIIFRPGRPVVYDFDDAFFHIYDNHQSSFVRRALGGKIEPLLRGAAACCCGNDYLLKYAKRFCDTSIILPTVVDTRIYEPRKDFCSRTLPIIGWIGSPSTWANVRPILPLLRQLAEEKRARIRVVGAGARAEQDRFDGLEIVEWSEATEVAEVQQMDTGIMPLFDLPFEQGKSGYKLIQYMACGLPVIASPVGANKQIVDHPESGFLAASLDEWRSALIRLCTDENLRRQMGEHGRRRVVDDFSLAAHAPRFIELLRSVAPVR